MNKYVGIYIHIPFCVKKCDYCDFLSAPAGPEEQRCYMEALREEIRIAAGLGAETNFTVPSVCNFLPDRNGKIAATGADMVGVCSEIGPNGAENSVRPVDTVFFGGGTPSILPAGEIAKTLDTVRACFNLTEDAEITVESNPGTLTEEKCRIYRDCGVNRLSIGLQSAENRLLRGIGRIHTFEEFLESYEAARRAGFTNINVDLMSGLPGQSVQDHVDTLHRVLALGPEHISAYSLILEEGTPLYEKVMGQENREKERNVREDFLIEDGKKKNVREVLPSEDEEMEMYVKTREILETHGYHRYEISNYSLPGRECRHNLRYWDLSDYLGFGIGAASFTDGCRYRNTDDRRRYVRLLRPGLHDGDMRESNRADGRIGQQTYEVKRNAECEEQFLCENKCKDESQGQIASVNDLIGELRTEFSRETDRELMEEFVFLGLRKTEGIRKSEFADRFGREFDAVYGDVKNRLVAQGTLQECEDGARLRLTDRGIDFSNEVLAEFLL
ncbi:MAG: radical SAM family heme chaperone HemW [Lachnospiraceae bacterium]|nr:radical SAM family heme chaperone HemW [Lachnospiraceae bacterium]